MKLKYTQEDLDRAVADERKRLNGERPEPWPLRSELLNIIKGYETALLRDIVKVHGDKLRPNWRLK